MTLRPRKSLGQHFLSDTSYCYKLIRHADICPCDTVVEIGPGTGELTRILLQTSKNVIAIEFDREMIHHLKNRFAQDLTGDLGKLQLINADVLKLDWNLILPEGSTKFVGNLPYNISTRILRNLAEIKDRFKDCTVMVQKEVSDRILATPPDKNYGYFSLFMEYHFQRLKGFDVPPDVFVPQPKIMSHVLKLIPQDPPHQVHDYEAFFKLLKLAFHQRRKTVWNNLKRDFKPKSLSTALRSCDINMQDRPQNLNFQKYACLSRELLYSPAHE